MMRPILAVIGFVTLAFACDDGWESFGDSCYKFDNTNRNYLESEAFCVGEGAHLVSIHGDDENTFVIDRSEELSMGATWIGLDDKDRENVFSYLDGTPFYRGGYTNGEPNDYGGNQDCSYFPFHIPLGWDDMRCINNANPMCERAAPCPEGWTVRVETGNCYKWLTDRVTYAAAKSMCSELDSYLVSITSPEENVFVIEQVATPSSGSNLSPTTWVGLDDETDEGMLRIVEPDSNEFLGRFYRGEPNDGGDNQDCIWFPYREEYMWDDVSCTANRKVVCKKPNPEAQFGNLSEKTQGILLALNEGCITTETAGDNENLCEKLVSVLDGLIEMCGGAEEDSD